MEHVSIVAQARAESGKKSNKALRREGRIPAVLYGGDEVTTFSTTHKDVKSMVFTPDFKIAEIDVNGKVEKAILKDIQFHPVTDEIVHMDFLRLIDDVNVKVEVPVRFKGVSPGVLAGGKLIQSIRKVKIMGTPANLVNELFVDISNVELGGAVRVREIEVPEGLVVINEPAIPVANVEVPRALKSAAAAEAKEGAAATDEPAEAE